MSLGGSSETRPIVSEEQREFTAKQTELAEFQLEELERQRRLQSLGIRFALKGFRDFESAVSGLTGDPTEQQQALIDQAYADALASGESDILAFQAEATSQLTNELAPSLGLLPGDTPVLDRGADIAAESARQQGTLVSDLSAQKAEASLNYPLAAQGFQAQLAQNAFNNRLQLIGNTGGLGLGLAGAAQPVPPPSGGSVTTTTPGVADIAGGVGGLLFGLGSL